MGAGADKKENKKRRKWVVTSAWPYVNATPHLGNMIGSVLSADVFARYLRLKGDDVVFVSGSDEHGTPIAVEAIKQNVDPQELAEKKHKEIVKIFKDWNISYDNYTHTHNPTHIKFVQDFYLQVQKNGYVSEEETEAYYCPVDDFFLPDRFIEGTCPYCGMPGARGDQCDNPECGRVLEPDQLIDPHCKICLLKDEKRLTTPIKKKTKHWYFEFPLVEEKIHKFIENNNIIPPNAKQMTLNACKQGLPKRAITRDLKWGIPAPFKGAENKTIYVWFEAVLGYISAVKEWAEKIKKEPQLFSYFWNDPETRTVFFIGKDNIVFHLLIFPGLLFGYNDNLPKNEQFTLPYNVSSTEFLMYENDKFSKTRGVGIWTDEALQIAHVDYWRYNLIRNRPEGRDVSFIWSEFLNNVNELNDKIGNFVHRALTFIFKRFDAKVPKLLELDEKDKEIVNLIKNAPQKVGSLLEQFRLKEALEEVVNIAHKGNIYLNDKAPWKIIKSDKDRAGHVFNLCLQLSRTIAILLHPFCPESAEKIMSSIGCDLSNKEEALNWDSAAELKIPDQCPIQKPAPVFQKINPKEILDKIIEIRKSKGEDFKIFGSLKELIDAEESGKITPGGKAKQKSTKKQKKKADLQGQMDGKINYKFFSKFNFNTAIVKDISITSITANDQDQNNAKQNSQDKTPAFEVKIKAIGHDNSEISLNTIIHNSKEHILSFKDRPIIYLRNADDAETSIILKVKYNNKETFLTTDENVPPGSKIL
ncbi:MAG: methionine--tRNA ligase [Promethearchaeota archaeon]